MRPIILVFATALLVSGTAIARDCTDPIAQAEIAARARDKGTPMELFTMQMQPLGPAATGPTKQGYAILHDVYTLKQWDGVTHKLVRARICALGGQATSAASFPADVKMAIEKCQSSTGDRVECIQSAIPEGIVKD